jgi:chromosome partitioning protein
MLIFKGPKKLHRIVVLNPKGGSGKSTLAFNIAGYLASQGRSVAVVDMDVQGSSTEWLMSRGSASPYIHSIPAPYISASASGSDQVVEIPEEYGYVVVDAPASVSAEDLIDFTCGAHAVLVPVLPSTFDMHAASRLISSLLLVARISRTNKRLGIVANRVRHRTLAYRRLKRFLDSLSISVVGTLRDSQNYVQAAHNGLSIHEMPPSSVRRDREQWEEITSWLENRLAKPLTARDWYRPVPHGVSATERAETASEILRARRFAPLAAAAVCVTAFAALFGSWQIMRSDRSQARELESLAMPAPAPRPIERFAASAVSARSDPAPQVASVQDQFRNKWQLSGVAHSHGESVVLLSERGEQKTHRIRAGHELDGWLVKAAGPNYAVFTLDDHEVRLVLSDEQTD